MMLATVSILFWPLSGQCLRHMVAGDPPSSRREFISMSTTTGGHRIVAVLGSLVLSLFTLFGLSSAAIAAQGNEMGDITDTAGTINVYKHANPGGTLNYGNGNEAPAGGAPLGGVSFTLYKVEGIDLVNGNAGWDVVGKVTDPTKPVEPALDDQAAPTKVTIGGQQYGLTKIETKTTFDGTGLADFAGLHPGLYIVIEGESSGLTPTNLTITAKAAPFFVVLPIKDANGAWSYTAHVYPKNTVSTEPDKSVEVKNDADGVLTWTVEQALPTFDDTNKLTEFRFADDLSAAGDTSGTLASVKVTVNGVDKTADFNKELIGTDLFITAKNPGDLPSGGKVVATYTTQGKSGSYENKVETFINKVNVGFDIEKGYLGKITVQKVDSANMNLFLSGAVFKVCVDVDAVEETKDCPAVGTITTGPDGTGSLDKLKIQNYVLFETAAPAGYTFDPDRAYKATLTNVATEYVLTVENTKTNVPTLPLTGADGQLIMTIGGVALVLLAGGVFLVARKKRSEK